MKMNDYLRENPSLAAGRGRTLRDPVGIFILPVVAKIDSSKATQYRHIDLH
jgi:hypothetical protein